MKPLLKYVGGKTKLLPELRARMPKTFGRYYEPFVGGAALFLDVEPEKATIGDTNAALIDTYIAVACQTDAVIAHLIDFKAQYLARESLFYYEMRLAWNGGRWNRDAAARAAAFIFLNKTCFNGLWRVNAKGEFNVPAGKYKNPGIFDSEQLRAVAPLLKRAHLMVAGYEVSTAEARKGDFAYFDPPYDPVSKTSNFTGYTAGGFGDDAQAKLALHIQVLHERGVHVMASNNDTPMIRNLYRGFKIETVRCARSINSDATKRGEIDEVLITGAA